MPLQQVIRFYIPPESTCCLFLAYCHEFLNREPYDGFVIPVEREEASRICLIFQVIRCHKDEDSECVTLERIRGIESNHAYTEVSGVASQYILRSGSLWHPLSSSMLEYKQIFH